MVIDILFVVLTKEKLKKNAYAIMLYVGNVYGPQFLFRIGLREW